MRIEFKAITIKNFKGVLGERTINFNPTLTQIMGANHAGKTTIVDAVRWVLFDKNSEGMQVFGIDPKDENGQVIHHLDNTVVLELTADGKDYKLEKVRTETWTKPRKQENPLAQQQKMVAPKAVRDYWANNLTPDEQEIFNTPIAVAQQAGVMQRLGYLTAAFLHIHSVQSLLFGEM